ncbi:hypothetical protein LTR08_007786 [Meristemomyces frigidus]|nr:hypothetical protein LTR08_007786 [Meristemomyces frigidus]
MATTTAPAYAPGPPFEPQHHQHYPMMQTAHYAPYPPTAPPHGYPAMPGYPPYPPMSMADPRLPPPMTMPHQSGLSNKRLAPQPHPAESPAKKKQSKWTADEDASIIELRGNGMKWEDISRHLPGRSAISCRLRFQNYLERRSEWDEEKKNKLARLYERFRKDMWEKISKEMQLPWRAAEAMHWQIGEVEMAQRANVPVFHLAGQGSMQQQQMSTMPEVRTTSTSPPSATELPTMVSYSHTHNHSLPQVPPALPQPLSPVQARLRRNSAGSSPSGPSSSLRDRADSARSVPTALAPPRTLLPPLGDMGAPPAQTRYNLPPVVTSPDVKREYR